MATNAQRQAAYRARQMIELKRLRDFEKAVLRERERGSAAQINHKKPVPATGAARVGQPP
jgi:hypothetical protein